MSNVLILDNENGTKYRILKGGEIGKSALLVRCNNEPYGFIVCDILEKRSWTNGKYFDDLEKALDRYKSKFTNTNNESE